MARLAGWLLALLFVLGSGAAAHAELTRFPAPQPGTAGGPGEGGVLVIYSSTDLEFIRPLIDGFQALNTDVEVHYHLLPSLELYNRVLDEVQEQGRTADVLLSAAMDLQMKLANDGYASPLTPPRGLPEWAVWRREVFGFTHEPAVIAYNRDGVPPQDVPGTREELRRLLETQPERYRGKVATYDPELSGVGFLFASQDARRSPVFWKLVDRLGAAGVRLYGNSVEMLDALAAGEVLIAYNVLGSYARAHAERLPQIGIALPRDYTLVMSRLVLIPKAAVRPDLARRFVDFLLGADGQRIVAGAAHLYAILPQIEGELTAKALRAQLGPALLPIPVNPGLLLYLDQDKRRRFLQQWERALDDTPPPPGR